MPLSLQHGLRFSIADMHLGNMRRKCAQDMSAGSVPGTCYSACKGQMQLVLANVKNFDMLGVRSVFLSKHLDFYNVSGMRKIGRGMFKFNESYARQTMNWPS